MPVSAHAIAARTWQQNESLVQMLKIQVSHSYFLRYDPKQWERGKPYPPLATLQVAALLRERGHTLSLFDAMLAEDVQDYTGALHAAQPDMVVFYEDNFNFLTKMCLSRMREAACQMIAQARAAGCRVLVAGSDASDNPDVFLAAGAHAVLIGEGIAPLLELVARVEADPTIDTGAWLAGVARIATSPSAEAHVHRGAQPPDARLSGLPAWDLVDMPRYQRFWQQRHGYFSLNMAASRGCPFRCNWCAKPIWGNHYKRRDAEDVAAEMIHLKRSFQPDHIWMADDIFGFHIDWVETFAQRLTDADGAIPFTIQTRADLASERMAAALARAGCAEAWLGAESGSQRILDKMTKGTTVGEVIAARQRLGARGIRVGFFIQLGYLGEELDDILATRALVTQANPDIIGVSVSYPLPGTKFYEEVKNQLGGKTHWQDSDDLAMMFRGAYGSEFYRSVRDLLHTQVDLQQARATMSADAFAQASEHLEARWSALIASEKQHRTEPLVSVATGQPRQLATVLVG
ncbi:B12-binding domain-containing radical SAM protein [Xanthomonas hortorum]|uniref:B12-binding domain-containing radical SAM protein n=1 Tax=Xanthomonas hortorum TaxID=56454 RepID=UPI001E30A707|nr:radical SAM protein [Xanthomonas hortorum]MCC8554949.1 B12-binding domain-containing radical SAM protein [Xanthomonas hortorum pv. gardneri]MCE4364953.1 B12-binding domain-containing radical SAM protein [Xanthomonas hortorum]